MYILVGKLHIYSTGDRDGIKILNWNISGEDIRTDAIF